MATKITVLLEADPTPDLTSRVRHALKHMGPCEVFIVADTTDEEVVDVVEAEAEEDLDLDGPETCPTCGHALDDLEGEFDGEPEGEPEDQQEEEDSLDE